MAGVGTARAVWIPSAVALVGSVAYFAVQPYQIDAPGQLVQYVSSDKSLSIKHPANWKRSTSGMHAVQDSVTFKPSKGVLFRLDSDLAGSLMADITRSAGNSLEGSAGALEDMSRQSPELAGQLGQLAEQAKRESSPLEKVHEMYAGEMAEEYDGYQESGTGKTTLGGLEAVESSFTLKSAGAWGPRTISGKRLTALTSERAIRLLYCGPKDQMKTLEPVFEKMRASITFGPSTPGGR